LIGLDVQSGKPLWKAGVGKKTAPVRAGIWCPVPWIHGGKTYVVSGLACLEPKTGKEVWRIEDWTAHGMVGDGVIVNDILFTAYSKGKKEGIAWRGYQLSETGAKRIWDRMGPTAIGKRPAHERGPMGPSNASISGDPERGWFAFKAGHREWCVVEAATGKLLGQLAFGNKFWGACTLYGDRLFDGYRRMVRFDSTGKMSIVGQLNCTMHTCVSPLLADGRYFVHHPQGIVCYDLRKE
jgi:hypothetical protein